MKALFASITLLVSLSVNAFGLGGDIKFPEIGHREKLDKMQDKDVRTIIDYMENDLRFIEGSFVNEFSNQRFGGASAKVSAFISLLSGTGLWKVQVVFRDFGEQESALTLSQTAPESLGVVVNSGREDFLLKDFQRFLPGIEEPAAKTPKAEQAGADQPASAPESKLESNSKPKPESERRCQ
ncbi:hypothetical protein OAE61_04035 [Verrucomicrobiales bacterium]|nr:hypothetical protein [Verrucomicrobiales bacterium]MDB4662783.1 hypothetical protein [Verrucomicrobiales bacterium]MDC0276632.1 hypothetical protein [Verrucomicrobiales bacterium]MDC0291728.1 hypothetical protein [Verrucomicrobiales bacterium]